MENPILQEIDTQLHKLDKADEIIAAANQVKKFVDERLICMECGQPLEDCFCTLY